MTSSAYLVNSASVGPDIKLLTARKRADGSTKHLQEIGPESEERYNGNAMTRFLRQLPQIVGVTYAVVAIIIGAREGRLEWLPLIAGAAAVLAGVWALSAARWAEGRTLRYTLIAFGVLAPISLLPDVFQPVSELTAFQLLAGATAFDIVWLLSAHLALSSTVDRRRRWAWALLCYGGALTAAAAQLPWYTLKLAWLLLCSALLLTVTLRRLFRPENLEQESAAHHGLWLILATLIAGAATAALVGLSAALHWVVAATMLAHSANQALEQFHRRDTSFTMRRAASPFIVAGLLALGTYAAALQGPQWNTAAVVAALFATALFATPLTRQVRTLANKLPPKTSRQTDAAIAEIEDALAHSPDLEELTTALEPLARALPRGAIALVSFDPNWTVILSDGKVEHRSSGPGEPLQEVLAAARQRSMLASSIVDRSVRETDLRPAAELIDELGAQMIIPLPGGSDGSLSGALLVGCSRWGLLRARIGAKLDLLAPRLGPQMRSSVVVEGAGRRIAELETEKNHAEDELERQGFQMERLTEENRLLRSERAGNRPTEIVGRSTSMKRLLRDIDQAAAIEGGLLIRGESGTGRRLVARSIHAASKRRESPLVQFDCVNTPLAAHLIALVGQSKEGRSRPGLLELADGGTLLLEEVGALALEAQAELIRVLGSGEVAREQVGSAGPVLRTVDVRVLATTGRTSELALERDTILPELYDRLRSMEVKVPPLRERQSDIADLAQFFLSKLTAKLGLEDHSFTKEALQTLETQDWPGNVSQLRAVVELALLHAPSRRISSADLPLPGERRPAPPVKEVIKAELLEGTLEEIERAALEHALANAEGNKAEAARQLGMKRTTFTSRLRKHGLG